MTASIWTPGSSLPVGSISSGFRFVVTDDPYNCPTDGVTSASSAIQAAVNAAEAAGGGTVICPSGYTYLITESIVIESSNVSIEATGAVFDARSLAYDAAVRASGAVFKFQTTNSRTVVNVVSPIAAASKTITVDDITGFSPGDIIRIYSTQVLQDMGGGIVSNYGDQNKVVSISGYNVTLESPVLLPIETSGYTVTCSRITPITGNYVRGGKFIGGGLLDPSLPAGNGQCGVTFLGVDYCGVQGAEFTGFQGIAVFAEYSHSVVCSTLTLEGFPSTLTSTEAAGYGFYGVYLVRGRNGIVQNSIATRIRHMCDATEWISYLQSDNICNYSSRAAFGSHQSVFGLVITNNKADNCYAGATVRAHSTKISGNDFHSIYGTLTTAVTAESAVPGYLEITDNKFVTTSMTNGSCNITGYYSPLIIRNNSFNSPVVGVDLSCKQLKDVLLDSNEYNGQGSGNGYSITYPGTGYPLLVKNIKITNNTARNYTGSVVVMRGSQLQSAPADQILIDGNVGYPVPASSGAAIQIRAEGFYGTEFLITNNGMFSDTSVTVQIVTGAAGRFQAYPVIENNFNHAGTNFTSRVVGSGTSGVVTEGATVRKGSIVLNHQPDIGEAFAWIATTAGTEGTLAGITGTLGAGSTSLALVGNTVGAVYIGCYIVIPGAGVAAADLTVQVTALSLDLLTATVSVAATTAVTAVTIAYSAPVFTAYGIIGGGSGGGVTDHGALTGLADDDHTQYLNNTRGDARYLQLTNASEVVDDRVAALLVAGTNVTLTYNDAANTLTIAASGGGTGGDVYLTDLSNPTVSDTLGTALLGHHAPNYSGASYNRPLRDKLLDEVWLSDFGQLGVGYSQDQALWNEALTHLANRGGTLRLPAGTIFLEQLDLTGIGLPTGVGGIGVGYSIIGAGSGKTLILAKGDKTAIVNAGEYESIHLEGFTLDCQWNVIGSTDPVAAATASHGISMQSLGGDYASQPSGITLLRDIVVQNYKNSGILIFGTAGVHKQVFVENCHVYGGFDYLGSPGPVTNNGMLFEFLQDSSFRNVSARNIKGSPGYGVQLKNDCRNCTIDNAYAYNCVTGVVFGYTAGAGVTKSRISNAVAIRCDRGFDARYIISNSIHFSLIDQEGVGGHAFNLNTGSERNRVKLDLVRNVAANYRVVNVGSICKDNVIDIGISEDCNLGGDKYVVEYYTDSEYNNTRIHNIYATDPAQRIPSSATATRGGVKLGTALNNSYEQVGMPMTEYCEPVGTTINQRNTAATSVLLDTNSGPGTVSTINSAAVDGKILSFRIGSSTRPITVDNLGNIALVGSTPTFLFSGTKDNLVLRFNGTNWCEVSRSDVA